MNIISSNNNRKLPVVTLKQLSTTTNQQQQQQQSSIDATINKIATSSSSSIMDDYDESRILKSLSDETKHQPQQQQSIQNGCILDDSLTSLTWLQNLNLLKANNAKNNTTNNNSTNSSVIASAAVNDSTINNKNMNSESTPTLASKTSTTTTTTCVTEFPVVMNDTTSTQSSNSFALIGISYPPLSPPLSVQCSPNSTNSSSNHSTKTTTTLNTNMTAINTPNKFAKTAIGTAAKSNNGKSGYSRANSSGTTVKKIKQAVLSSSVSSKKTGEAISTNQSTTSSPSAAFHSDSNAKPPYSYSQLIVLSMRESRASKMTLQMIYDWIIDNFGYFRKADPNWQVTFKNSIRHNLSLNKCFKKIARQKDEPGKGGFWTLDEEYKKQLLCNERSPTTSSVVVGESAANESDAVATNTTSSTSTTTTSTTKDGQLPSTMETMQSLKRRRKSPKSENPRQPKSTIRKMDEQKSSGSGTSKAKKLKTAALKHSMSVPDGKQSTPSSSETSTSSTLEANNSYLAPFSTNASNTNTNNISSLQLQQNSSWQQQHTHQHHHNHQHHPSCHQSSFTCSCGGMNGGYSTYNSYYGQQQTSTPSYNRSMTCCTSMPSSSTNLYHSHHHHNPQNHHPHMVDDLSNTFSSSFGHEIIKSMDDDVEATAAGLFNFEQALECNFDLDPLTSSQAPVQSSVGTHIPTNDMSNHHHIHNQHHSSMPPSVHPLNRFQHQSTTQQQTVDTHQNTTTTADVELNELFEYTSQFSTSMNQQNGVSQNNGGDYLSYLSTPNAYDMLGGEANSQGGSTTSSSGAESPLDQVSKSRLDLTIQGHGIKQPKWWMDSLITSGNNDPLNNSHSQSASSTTSFHFIDLDNNITGSDLLGMPSKRDAADECDSASMFINTASLCYDVGNQAAVTSTGDKELLSSSLAAAVDGKDII